MARTLLLRGPALIFFQRKIKPSSRASQFLTEYQAAKRSESSPHKEESSLLVEILETNLAEAPRASCERRFLAVGSVKT